MREVKKVFIIWYLFVVCLDTADFVIVLWQADELLYLTFLADILLNNSTKRSENIFDNSKILESELPNILRQELEEINKNILRSYHHYPNLNNCSGDQYLLSKSTVKIVDV